MPAPGPALLTLARIAAAAGVVVMHHYGTCQARAKADNSPVTDADQDAEALILKELAAAFPGVPVVAEEAMAAGRNVAAASRFFLVDPLDGTREFLSGNGEFTVNIAEIRDGVPVMAWFMRRRKPACSWGMKMPMKPPTRWLRSSRSWQGARPKTA